MCGFNLPIQHYKEQSKTSFKLLLCFSGTGQGLILSVGLIVNHGPKGNVITQKLRAG